MKHISAVFLISVFATGLVFGQDKGSKIDELVSKYNELGNFEGSLLVAENGGVIFKKGYGLANREWNIPNRPDTKYDVGSLTKSFTAVLTLRLVQKGLLKLDGKISDYLADYRQDTGRKVTIHHLLSHTSGLPPFWSREFARTHGRNEFDKDYLTKTYMSGDLLFEPGSEAQYSDTNYYILGRIIENVTGKSYREVKENDLFKALGMNDSGYYDQESVVARRASGYIKTRAGYINSPYTNRKIIDAAGASLTTVEDLFLFDQALYGNKLLGNEYRDRMFTNHATSRLGNRQVHFGYGFFIGDIALGDDRVPLIQAGGNRDGFTAIIYRLPQERRFIAMLTNAGPDFFNEQLHEICARIIDILYDRPYELPRPSIAAFIAETISAKGIDAAVNGFRELKANGEHRIDERELNGLGYSFLRRNMVREAIAIFRLNAAEFPESFNVYDSLAEAYMAIGEKALAIENYEKSLKLNPSNENAVRQLEELKKN